MIIVGIDVAKNKHDVIIIDSKGDSLTKSFRIPNSHKGANTLIDKIKTANPSNRRNAWRKEKKVPYRIWKTLQMWEV